MLLSVGQLPIALSALQFVAGLKRDFLQRSTPGCSNSDGVTGFNFSHAGLWIPGYSRQGNGFTKTACAEACSKRDNCIAFSGAFTEYGWNGACYLYSSIGADTPSANDRAYRRCAVVPSRAPGISGFNYGLHLLRAEATPSTAADLVAMASTMQGELDNVSQLMVSANQRMRRLKSTIAGESAILVNSSRLAFMASKLTTNNRDSLRSISRSRSAIERSYKYLNASEEKLDRVLQRVEKSRNLQKESTKASNETVKPLSYYEPNVTFMETVLANLTKPESLKAIDGLVSSYDTLQSNVSDVVKRVLQKNLRGLVDVQREALRNYTYALSGNDKKDPCCCP